MRVKAAPIVFGASESSKIFLCKLPASSLGASAGCRSKIRLQAVSDRPLMAMAAYLGSLWTRA